MLSSFFLNLSPDCNFDPLANAVLGIGANVAGTFAYGPDRSPFVYGHDLFIAGLVTHRSIYVRAC